MTKKEVVDLISSQSNRLKREMKNINEMIQVGKEEGYEIVKRGPDNYDVYEENAIKDFRKPLIIKKDDKGSCIDSYKGAPIGYIAELFTKSCGGIIFPYEAWCYLANKADGEQIDLKEFGYFNNLKLEENVKQFDMLKSLGHIKETDENIIFYLKPQDGLSCRYMYLFRGSGDERIAPIIY